MKTLDPMTVVTRYMGQTPVPVFDILGELGLGPEFRPLSNDVSGWIERGSDGRYTIVINATHPPTRQRFTAAHELAHFIYHRDLLGNGVGDNRAYRAEGTPFRNDRILPRHERQANSVAANILMPRETIYRLISQDIRDPGTLAERLGVSEDAMRIRLGYPRLAA
jgi:hypothetical protein